MKFFLKITLFFFLLSYGLFYYAYKFSSPEVQGLKDYTEYSKLYKNWDYDSVTSPFNSRLLSTYGTYLLCKTGFYYHTNIVFSDKPSEKVIFFNALLFNYIFIVLTAVLIFYFSWYQGISFGMSIFGGVVYLFSFSTIFFNLTPLTEAFSAFITVLIFLSIQKQNYWYVPLLILAIFQREYIFFIFGLIAAFQWLIVKENRTYYLKVLFCTIICFLVYFILRKTLFYTPHHDEQVVVTNLFSNIFNFNVSLSAYINQAILTQNIFVLYIILLAYKKIKGLPIDRNKLSLILLLFLQMVVISMVGKLAQTIGRLFFLTAPLIIFYFLVEIEPVIKRITSKKN